MKAKDLPTKQGGKDGGSTLGSARRPSNITSLRIAFDNDIGDCDDDDDSFVFTDQMHHDQQFELLLDDMGEIIIDESKPEKAEEIPLLNQKAERPGGSCSPYQRESKINAYRYGQKQLLLEVLDEVDKIQTTTRKTKGFKEWKFAFGLVNCLLIAYMFGSYPQHFWILYSVETVFWMSYKFKGMYFAKPLSQALYYLDFCWVMNVLGIMLIPILIVTNGPMTDNIISIEVQGSILLACFGIFCGPVFMAAMVLPFVAFLFHDVNTMANLIIHLMPSMVMYTLRWHAVEIHREYPNIFPHLVEHVNAVNDNREPVGLLQVTLAVYFAWFIPYMLWMVSVGLKLPVISKDAHKSPPKYDTVFHSTWKGRMCELAGTHIWKRSKEISRDCSERNDYEIRDFLFYMVGHATGSCIIGIVLIGDLLCFRCGKTVHASLLWFTTILCAKRGADRYTYYVTSMYGQKLRRAFREVEVRQQKDQRKVSGGGDHYHSIAEENNDS